MKINTKIIESNLKINFNNNWKNLSEGECKLELIIKPKEIKL